MDKDIVFLVEELPEGGYEARAIGLSIVDGDIAIHLGLTKEQVLKELFF